MSIMDDFNDAFEDDDDDFDMPLAANAENKALHKAVKKMEREVLELDTDIDANSTRIKAMQDHLKNVNQEATLLKGVTDARQSEITSEKNMAVLWEQERVNLVKESNALEKKLKDDQEAQNNIQNEIFTAQSEIEVITFAFVCYMEYEKYAVLYWNIIGISCVIGSPRTNELG